MYNPRCLDVAIAVNNLSIRFLYHNGQFCLLSSLSRPLLFVATILPMQLPLYSYWAVLKLHNELLFQIWAFNLVLYTSVVPCSSLSLL